MSVLAERLRSRAWSIGASRDLVRSPRGEGPRRSVASLAADVRRITGVLDFFGMTASEKAAYNRAWYQRNREVVLARLRAEREADPGRVRAYNAAWKAANPARVQAHSRAYYERHREKVLAQANGWYAEHREEANRRNLGWQARNRVRKAAGDAKWRQDHPGRVREAGRRRRARKLSAAGAEYTTDALIAGRVAMFGGCCYYCGVADAGTIDHRIPLIRGGSHWPANLVPCCVSCNSRKGAKTEFEFLDVIGMAA